MLFRGVSLKAYLSAVAEVKGEWSSICTGL